MAKKDNQLAFNQSVDYANIKALEKVRQLSLCRREAAIGSRSDAIEPTKRRAHLCSVLQPNVGAISSSVRAVVANSRAAWDIGREPFIRSQCWIRICKVSFPLMILCLCVMI